MRKSVYLLVGLFPLLLTGCNNESKDNEGEELSARVIELERTVDSQQQIINELTQLVAEERENTKNQSEEFSYLDQLSETEQLSYKNYLDEKKSRLFNSFLT
ncbi:MAG: hypothetical protein JJU16_08860 [Alkalibacterium sp.]|nr:hypothetical protein [Alkalibacterium sp.]